jgi:flagellar biosynthetic protein FliQ
VRAVIDEGIVMEIFSEAMMAAFKMAAPLLIISLVVGLIIAIIQAATQIHEQTITFVPKLFAIAIVLLLSGPWLLAIIRDFYLYVMEVIARLV